MRGLSKVKEACLTDFTLNRARRLAATGFQAFPAAALDYAVEKVPIVGWLPRYNPRWLINDLIAGLTLGLMLIPQGLSYARIATVPVQYGLMSSWLPSAIYAFMGTTKDLSTGPTSLISLLTAGIIEQLRGQQWSPSEIASAVAMMMGIYGLAIGLLKLGFLLEFISLPILSGFISAVAITIALNQMGALLGEPNVSSDSTASQIHDIFHQLPQANGYACAVGFTGIFFLAALDHAGRRWGGRNRVVWFLSITRAFIALVIFTGVGYAVNKGRASSGSFLFDVVQLKSNGQEPPSVPSAELLSRVAGPSVAVFVGSAVEHTAIARGFGVKNNYVTDQSQELTFYGVANIANSFFHAVGVGGAMSRTAVNSACHVKSPLSGLVTTAVVLVSIFKLVGTLYWIPKATLSAIIITAVWPLISPPSVFYRYWKTSLADFVSSMIAFWVSLFVSTQWGIVSSVGFNVVYILLRQVFARVSTISDPGSELALALDDAQNMPRSLAADTRVFRFGDSVFFPNAYRVKMSVLDAVKTHHTTVFFSNDSLEAERNWSVSGEKRLAKLRRLAGISDPFALPPIRLVILDFGRSNHVDATACTQLGALLAELRAYGGPGVLVRFSGMSDYVRERFERAGWTFLEEGSEGVELMSNDKTVQAYRSVAGAVVAPRPQERMLVVVDEKDLEKQEEKGEVTGECVERARVSD